MVEIHSFLDLIESVCNASMAETFERTQLINGVTCEIFSVRRHCWQVSLLRRPAVLHPLRECRCRRQVDDTVITAPQLEKQFQSRVNSADQPPAPEEMDDLKLQVLNQMINDQILLKMATDSGLNASDAEVDVKFNEFKSQYTKRSSRIYSGNRR